MEFDNYGIMFLLGAFIIGYLIGQMVGYVRAINGLAKEIADKVLKKHNIVDDDDTVYNINIEKFQGQYMAYGKNHQFLAQSNTITDLTSRILDRLPETSFKFNHDGQFSAEEIQELITAVKSRLDKETANDTTG